MKDPLTLEAYDYDLPPDLIAQTPIEPRDAARLLVVNRATGRLTHAQVRDLDRFLRPGDLLVANESRVIPARLLGRRSTGGRVEALLVQPLGPNRWAALVRPARRVRPGERLLFERETVRLTATVVGTGPEGLRVLEFAAEDVVSALRQIGQVPLPPYIRQPLADPERYQTVYARTEGSVAAPTAGLHFTPELIARLQAQGVHFAWVTLHVGLDTFRPIKATDPRQHQLHAEFCHLSPETAALINAARVEGRRIIAIGTTTVRVLETAGLLAAGLPAPVSAVPPDPAAVVSGESPVQPAGWLHQPARGAAVVPFTGWTRLFIYPGFAFRVVEGLLTNFHLPRSTLLLLVSAFAGRDLLLRAYREAVAQRYRFYSFGDAMLIL
jgi:S-adenosylmethionine:tRNA ribosyltransferase-isomerase